MLDNSRKKVIIGIFGLFFILVIIIVPIVFINSSRKDNQDSIGSSPTSKTLQSHPVTAPPINKGKSVLPKLQQIPAIPSQEPIPAQVQQPIELVNPELLPAQISSSSHLVETDVILDEDAEPAPIQVLSKPNKIQIQQEQQSYTQSDTGDINSIPFQNGFIAGNIEF